MLPTTHNYLRVVDNLTREVLDGLTAQLNVLFQKQHQLTVHTDIGLDDAQLKEMVAHLSIFNELLTKTQKAYRKRIKRLDMPKSITTDVIKKFDANIKMYRDTLMVLKKSLIEMTSLSQQINDQLKNSPALAKLMAEADDTLEEVETDMEEVTESAVEEENIEE
jgi:hypothetical protein